MSFIDERVPLLTSSEPNTTAGNNTLSIKLPTPTLGKTEIRDLRISIANVEAPRGRVACYLYSTKLNRVLDVLAHGQQTDAIYLKGEIKGAVNFPQVTDLEVRGTFENCIALDLIEMVVTYTLRRFI